MGAIGASLKTIKLSYFKVQLFQDSQETLDGFLVSSGANSVKAQIESDTTLNGEAQSVRVVSAGNYGVYEINNINYLGVEFIVEVIA